jgi:hypothetical protein
MGSGIVGKIVDDKTEQAAQIQTNQTTPIIQQQQLNDLVAQHQAQHFAIQQQHMSGQYNQIFSDMWKQRMEEEARIRKETEEKFESFDNDVKAVYNSIKDYFSPTSVLFGPDTSKITICEKLEAVLKEIKFKKKIEDIINE